jgi:hypothetical protein
MKASQRESPSGVHTLTGPRLESWRLLWEEMARDDDAMARYRAWEARRRGARPEMLELLRRFLAGGIGPEELRATFDRRAKSDWEVFGLKGMSGAMFLNRLVKHAADRAALAAALRAALPAPDDAAAARDRLGTFVAYLRELARSAQPEGRQIQPARAAFFLSAWWHAQDTERWPAFQPSARQALHVEEDLYAPTGDPTRDYLAFREAFLALASALKLTAWELEYLCWWHQHRQGAEYRDGDAEWEVDRPPVAHRERTARVAVVREPRADAEWPAEEAVDVHTHIQWLLANIGRKL